MGAYVVLLKEHEDTEAVVYRFGPDEQQMGKMRFDKRSLKCTQLEPVPVPGPTRYYFYCAATRVMRLCRSGTGFPDRTVYES